ncbi:MAG: hypothetical protein N3B12_03900 [Armatimonadetes bacterium]|nr:hypothetical protein [Armatimonadota bacterium]
MVKPVWKMMSLFLALGAFLGVGINEIVAGEELVWAVGKAVAAFFGSWIVLGMLGNALMAVLNRQEVEQAPEVKPSEKG